MKKTLKRLLPEPAYEFFKGIAKGIVYRDRPSSLSFPGDAAGVLECSIAYNKYGGYCVPRSARHRPAAQMVYAGKIWEPETIEFLRTHCGSGDVVHAGTFFGDFLPAISRACAPDAKVWAFEPNPESFRCAQVTIQLNSLSNVVLTNAGLGEREAELSLVTTDASGRALGGLSRIEDKAPSTNGASAVRVVAVDGIVPADRKVSIIQFDVEGFERQALLGAMETIRRSKPIILLETPPERAWLQEHLLSLGYRIEGDVHDNMILRFA